MNDYDVVKPLASGSFGQIYVVVHKLEKKYYVLKKISVGNLDTKEKDGVEQEVMLLQTVRHPNIVAYKDSFFAQDTLCIFMEYCDAGDVYTYLQKTRKNQVMASKDEPQIIEWFIQITAAVHFLHARSILHRDLKTQNIFLMGKLTDGASSAIKLGDFGIAKVLDSTIDLAKTQIGTPFYMSPEVFKNANYSYKSDIWGIGCVLYELVVGKHAFDAQSLNGLAVKVLKGKYTPVPPNCKCSKELGVLIKSLLSVNPTHRPSMTEILHMPIIRKKIKSSIKSVVNVTPAGLRNECYNQFADQLCTLGLGVLVDRGNSAANNQNALKDDANNQKPFVDANAERDVANLRKKLERLRTERDKQEETLRHLEETKRALIIKSRGKSRGLVGGGNNNNVNNGGLGNNVEGEGDDMRNYPEGNKGNNAQLYQEIMSSPNNNNNSPSNNNYGNSPAGEMGEDYDDFDYEDDFYDEYDDPREHYGQYDNYYYEQQMEPYFSNAKDRVIFYKELAKEQARLRYEDDHRRIRARHQAEGVQNRLRCASQLTSYEINVQQQQQQGISPTEPYGMPGGQMYGPSPGGYPMVSPGVNNNGASPHLMQQMPYQNNMGSPIQNMNNNNNHQRAISEANPFVSRPKVMHSPPMGHARPSSKEYSNNLSPVLSEDSDYEDNNNPRSKGGGKKKGMPKGRSSNNQPPNNNINNNNMMQQQQSGMGNNNNNQNIDEFGNNINNNANMNGNNNIPAMPPSSNNISAMPAGNNNIPAMQRGGGREGELSPGQITARREIESIHWQIQACLNAINKSKMTIETLQFRLQGNGNNNPNSNISPLTMGGNNNQGPLVGQVGIGIDPRNMMIMQPGPAISPGQMHNNYPNHNNMAQGNINYMSSGGGNNNNNNSPSYPPSNMNPNGRNSNNNRNSNSSMSPRPYNNQSNYGQMGGQQQQRRDISPNNNNNPNNMARKSVQAPHVINPRGETERSMQLLNQKRDFLKKQCIEHLGKDIFQDLFQRWSNGEDLTALSRESSKVVGKSGSENSNKSGKNGAESKKNGAEANNQDTNSNPNAPYDEFFVGYLSIFEQITHLDHMCSDVPLYMQHNPNLAY